MTTARSIPALLAAALAFAGCGGGSDGQLTKAEYEEKVLAVYGEVQEAFAATNVEPGQLAARIETAQSELREAAGELEDVEPPDDAAAANDQIAAGFRLYADELDRLRNAAERRDQATIDDFNARVVERESVKQIAEAAESLKFKGYDLGDIAEE